MPRKRAKHSPEYKHEALRRVVDAVDAKESVARVAHSLGLTRATLYRWLREHEANPSEAFRGNGKLTSQNEENRQLRRENALLREERDVLKKAVADSIGRCNTPMTMIDGGVVDVA